MGVKLVEAGPAGHRYKRVATVAEGDALAKCLEGFALLEEAVPGVLYIVGSDGPALAQSIPKLRDRDFGVALQLPDLTATPIAASPPDLVCAPPADFPITVGVLFTRSLTEARGMLSTPSSFILREPSAGWIETGKPVAAGSVSWGRLALAGAVLAVAGYLVFR